MSAAQAVAAANTLLALVNADRDRIAGPRRAAATALAVHQALQRQPIATSAALTKATGLTPATVNKSLVHLEDIGVVGELTNRQRGRVFSDRRGVEELAAELEAKARDWFVFPQSDWDTKTATAAAASPQVFAYIAAPV